MRKWQAGAALVNAKRAVRLGLLSFAVAVLVGAVSAPAFAAPAAPKGPKDDFVLKLDEDAIDDDYLAMKFADASRKLRQAIAICGRTGCSPTVLAQIHRDLGIIFVGWKKPDEAKGHFAQAFRADPEIMIPKELSTPEIKAAFAAGAEQAQSEGASADAPPAPPPEAPKKGAKTAKPKAEPKAESKADQRSSIGSTCGMDADCAAGSCIGGRCSEDEASSVGVVCETDRICGSGRACIRGLCRANPKRNWIGLAWQLDVVLLPAARDVCLNQNVYACMQGNGTWYEPNQMVTVPGQSDEVKAGPGLGTTRLMLSYERLVGQNATLGGRVGYVFGAGPASRSGTELLPVHVEARASLWFGSEPFTKTGLRPYIVASFGIAQVDVGVGVEVVEDPARIGQVGPIQTGTLSAWKRSGYAFASGGLGFLYALGRNTGFVFEVRGQRMFPSSATVIPIQFGYVVGI